MQPNSCKTCRNWISEPWECCPEQSDAFCIVELQRTTPGYRCEEWEGKPQIQDPPGWKKIKEATNDR